MHKNSIGFSELNILKVETYVPTYGKFCGSGWTAGTRDPVSLMTLMETEPIKVHLPSGKYETSLLDYQCKYHDRDYYLARGQKNEAELIAQADVRFIKGVIADYDSMTLNEKSYALLAIPAFAAKISLYDLPQAIVGNVSKQITEWGKQIGESSVNQTLAELTQTDGTTYSCLKDSEGNFVFSCTKDDETQSVTLDAMMNITGASQQLFDEFGDVYQETTIDIGNGISEISHRTDGIIDAQGVIVGKINQAKLDQFIELANETLDTRDASDAILDADPHQPQQHESEFKVAQLLGSLGVNVTETAHDELDNWFAQSEAIRLQAYRWDQADKSLQDLWLYGSDNTLAAYDLQSVMQAHDIDWDAGAGSWDSQDFLPTFEDAQFLSNDSHAFEYSLSDFDLGIDHSPLGSIDYNPSILPHFDSATDVDWSSGYIDPVVLKLGGGSVHTTNLQGSTVMFDMAANGQKVRTGWITPDHAFLVRDRNRNGMIDNSSEMFSEHTSPTAATGFAALAQLDSNRDGWVDYRDKAFKELRLWTDINVDGMTQKGELHPLSEFGITYLVVAKPKAKNVYDNGNLILNVNGYGGGNRRGYFAAEMAEVLFNFGKVNAATSIYLSEQSTTVRTSDGKTVQVLADKAAQTSNASMSGINLLVGGKGDVLNAGNSQQTLLIGNGGTTMNGNAGTTHFVVNGTANIVNAGTGSSIIEVHGDANTINASKGEVQIDVDGHRNRITIGSNDRVDLGGTANTLSAVGGGKDNQIIIRGQKEVVALSNADIALQEHASVKLNGRNNDITQAGHSTLSGSASGGTLMVWGEDNTATISNAFVAMTEGAELQLTGRNDKIVMAGEGELVVKGSAAGTVVNVFGQNNQVTMTGGAITMAAGAELDLAGRSNTITMLGEGELLARDRGQRVEVYGDDNQAWINGSTLTTHGNADIDIFGSGNALRATSLRADQIQREDRAYQRQLSAMDAIMDIYDTLLQESLINVSPELPSEPRSLPSAFAPGEAPVSFEASSMQDTQPWFAVNPSNSLGSRPLIPTPPPVAVFS
ncbi:MAG: hypothetical protein RL563_591 [Pseudomonadota bacterium]